MTDYSPHVDQGETYDELIALVEQGYQVPESRLLNAKQREDHQAAEQAAAEKLAADVAAAQKKAVKQRADHDAEHLPVLADMIEELKSAEQARVAEYPKLQAAKAAYNDVKGAVDARYRAIQTYVREHYGERRYDPQTDKPVTSSYIVPFGGGPVVDGEVVRHNGETEPWGE